MLTHGSKPDDVLKYTKICSKVKIILVSRAIICCAIKSKDRVNETKGGSSQ